MHGRKLFKRILVGLLAVVLLLTMVYWDLVAYAARQGYGQLSIVWKARPVSEFLADPNFPDSLKQRLLFIDEVRQYAIDSLGLKDTENYKTMYDQKGKEIMWVVMACKPFALEPKEWKFPIVGTVPYKGFFDEKRAANLRDQLEGEGWDVIVRNPGGWSTLGWFTDPILSKMLNRSEGDLANLIIHEMSHATIFVKDSVDFNENLATFIGDRGTEKFLIDRFGAISLPYRTYLEEDKDYLKYVDHMLRGARYLDSLYKNMAPELTDDTKRMQKKNAITHIVEQLDTLSLGQTTKPSERFRNRLPNNAYFMNFRQYQEKQSVFWEERGKFASLREYIAYLSERYPFL
ncbi:MAG TPA: aminopeptidase [Chryseolinea sp.]|nr:aminopeptidase [Chryseolinea sp.]